MTFFSLHFDQNGQRRRTFFSLTSNSKPFATYMSWRILSMWRTKKVNINRQLWSYRRFIFFAFAIRIKFEEWRLTLVKIVMERKEFVSYEFIVHRTMEIPSTNGPFEYWSKVISPAVTKRRTIQKFCRPTQWKIPVKSRCLNFNRSKWSRVFFFSLLFGRTNFSNVDRRFCKRTRQLFNWKSFSNICSQRRCRSKSLDQHYHVEQCSSSNVVCSKQQRTTDDNCSTFTTWQF